MIMRLRGWWGCCVRRRVGGVLGVWFVRMGGSNSVIERGEGVLDAGAEAWTAISTSSKTRTTS